MYFSVFCYLCSRTSSDVLNYTSQRLWWYYTFTIAKFTYCLVCASPKRHFYWSAHLVFRYCMVLYTEDLEKMHMAYEIYKIISQIWYFQSLGVGKWTNPVTNIIHMPYVMPPRFNKVVWSPLKSLVLKLYLSITHHKLALS